jgi:hypothetical protein
MGEVHHPHDAEDERQPNAQQGINAAEHESVYAMLEKFLHGRRHSELLADFAQARKLAARPSSGHGGERSSKAGAKLYSLMTLPPSILTR